MSQITVTGQLDICAQGNTLVTYDELFKAVLSHYPWQKNALFVAAAPELAMARQISRCHVLEGAGNTPEAQHQAANAVFNLCAEMGWKTLPISNGESRP